MNFGKADARGRFVCWLEGEEDESDGQTFEYRFETPPASTCATEFATAMAESGDYPEHVGQRFDVMVRDLDTKQLTQVTIGWDFDPIPYAGKSRVVEPGEGASEPSEKDE